MPFLTLPISAAGPMVHCAIGISFLRQAALKEAGQLSPDPVRCRALLDTGASRTCIDSRVVAALDVSPIAAGYIHTPSTRGIAERCSIYEASVLIATASGDLSIAAMPVLETHLSDQGLDVFLGRDVLARCVLTYDGIAGRFTLTF